MKYGVFIFMFIVFTVLVAYSALRGWQVLRDFSVLRTTYMVGMIVLFVTLFLGLTGSFYLPYSLARILAPIGGTALILFLYLFIAFFLTDLVRLVNYFFHFAPEGMLVFRKWALAGSALIILVVMLTGNYKFNHPEVVHLDICAENSALQNKELKIVAASDLHLGITIDKKRLNKYVDLINEQNPDIILLVGDMCDNVLAPVVEQGMNEDLRKLKAPLGVYAVPGNHEYIGGNITQTLDYLNSAGMNVLRDSAVLVHDSFYIIGRDDRTNRNRKPLSDIMEGLDRDKPFILLDHQPYHLEEAEGEGVDLLCIFRSGYLGASFPDRYSIRNSRYFFEILRGIIFCF